MGNELVRNIYNKKINNPDIDSLILNAKFCDTISNEINYHDNRFIYELLQNAVDAIDKATDDELDLQIKLTNDNITFVYNGRDFNRTDLNSLCSIGDSSKIHNSKAIGYKGFGFKTVFKHSSLVKIKTPTLFFKFDKAHWKNNYWNDKWGDKQQWLEEKAEVNPSTNIDMPWQIIPIPIDNNEELYPSFKNPNKIVISLSIDNETAKNIRSYITQIFENGNALIFLPLDKIKISFKSELDGDNDKSIVAFEISKTSSQLYDLINEKLITITTPKENNKWILSYKEEKIEDNVKQKLAKKDYTFLKGIDKVQFGFALKLTVDGTKIQPPSTKERFIYSYLPTSFNMNLPYLVNANFNLDAGRQQLQNNCEWNKWLFRRMPAAYFQLISILIKNNIYNINDDKKIASLLKLTFSEKNNSESSFPSLLEEAYYAHLRENLLFYKEDKAFKITDLLFSNSSFLDEMKEDLSNSYIDIFSEYNKSQNAQTKILASDIVDILGEKTKDVLELIMRKAKANTTYVYPWKIEFMDNDLFVNLLQDKATAYLSFQLIDILYKKYPKLDQKLINNIKSRDFIFTTHNKLSSVEDTIYKYELSEDSRAIWQDDNLLFIHPELHHLISQSPQCDGIIKWLLDLGVKEEYQIQQNLENIIKLLSSNDSLPEEEIIEYTFLLQDNFSKKATSFKGKVKVLNKAGNLMPAKDLYLSANYNLELNLDDFLNDNILISDKYSQSFNSKTAVDFFSKIGVRSTIKELSIDELLEVLTKLTESKYGNITDYLDAIYDSLANISNDNNYEKSFRAYGESNKLLAQDGKFYPLSELYIFDYTDFELNESNKSKIVYFNKYSNKLFNLFEAMGVNSLKEVINTPNTDNISESRKFQKEIKQWFSALKSKDTINKIILNTNFYPVNYGDIIQQFRQFKKDLIAHYDEPKNSFFFVKNWFEFENGDKEFQKALVTLINQPEESNNIKDIIEKKLKHAIIGYKGEQFVFNTLKDKYSSKLSKNLIEVDNYFEINNTKVIWINKDTESWDNHDLRIEKDNEHIYIECKTTTAEEYSKSMPLYLSPAELECIKEKNGKYIIARVYSIDDSPIVKYFELKALDNIITFSEESI